MRGANPRDRVHKRRGGRGRGGASAGGDPDGLAVDGDRVAGVKLAAAAGLNLAVDLHQTVLDQLRGLHTVLDQAGQLQQLAQPDHLVPDLEVSDVRSSCSLPIHNNASELTLGAGSLSEGIPHAPSTRRSSPRSRGRRAAAGGGVRSGGSRAGTDQRGPGARLDDGLTAAVVSFSTGLVLMVLITMLVPKGRAGLRAVLPALLERRFPRWYLLAGASGRSFCPGAERDGAADRRGTVHRGRRRRPDAQRPVGGPAGAWARREEVPHPVRVLGAVLTIAAVVWAVSPRLGQNGAGAGWLLPVLLPLAAGFLMSFQQAMNGTQTVHYGTPITATLVNFILGTAVLWLAWLAKDAFAGTGNALPGDWWYYAGGPLGCIYIGLTALLVRSLGVLLTGRRHCRAAGGLAAAGCLLPRPGDPGWPSQPC